MARKRCKRVFKLLNLNVRSESLQVNIKKDVVHTMLSVYEFRVGFKIQMFKIRQKQF